MQSREHAGSEGPEADELMTLLDTTPRPQEICKDAFRELITDFRKEKGNLEESSEREVEGRQTGIWPLDVHTQPRRHRVACTATIRLVRL